MHKDLVRNPERKSPLERIICRRNYNNNMVHKGNRVWDSGVDSTGSGLEPMSGSCE